VGFILSIGLAVFYVMFIVQRVDELNDLRFYYLILVLFGLAVSAVLFGAMNSYASLQGEHLGKQFQLTGPIVGVVLVVWFGLHPPGIAAEKTLTVRVFDRNGASVSQGTVALYLNQYIRDQSIDTRGQALFTELPARKSSEKVKIEVSSPGYKRIQFDTVLKHSTVMELKLELNPVILISGRAKRANENPIPDVEIHVDGTRYAVRSTTDGTYTLRLEEYTLGDKVTITSSHPRYEDKTLPLQITDPEIGNIDFVLNPVDN
jgi:hypothetical protein